MTRILADLPEADIEWLDARAAEQGKSRASVLREAVAQFRAQAPVPGGQDWIARGAGYWKSRADMADGVAWQRALRGER
jgi:hypothetical protein